MTMAELLILMADVNQHDAFERLAEEWFPDDGPPDFVFGMNSAFYFSAKGDPAAKAAMTRLAARYFDGTEPRPNLLVQDGRSARLTGAADIARILGTSSDEDPTVDDPKEQLTDHRRPLSFYIRHVDDRGRAQLPTSCFFSCLVDGEGYPTPGSLQRHDNYERVERDVDGFVKEFAATCEELRCFYAVSGFSLLTTSYSSYKSARNYPVFKRFPGLLYWNSAMAAPFDRSDDWILDVNWLTAINDEMLERLGGHDKVRAELDPRVAIHRFKGGVVFRTGEKPRLGDTNIGDVPGGYREVNRVLLPLRYVGWRSLDHVGAPPPLDDNQATTDWISRFD